MAEQMNHTVDEKAKYMLLDAGLPTKFWAEACYTATYLINRTLTRSIEYKTHHELWTGEKPSLNHLKIFGCKTLLELRTKWESKAKECLFLEYLEHSKGYCLFDEKTERVFKARDVVFLEDKTDVHNDGSSYMDSLQPEKATKTVGVASDDDDDQNYEDSVYDVTSKKLKEDEICAPENDSSQQDAVEENFDEAKGYENQQNGMTTSCIIPKSRLVKIVNRLMKQYTAINERNGIKQWKSMPR